MGLCGLWLHISKVNSVVQPSEDWHTHKFALKEDSMFALNSFMLCKELGRFKDLKTFLVYKELKCSSRPSCKEHFLGGTVF